MNIISCLANITILSTVNNCEIIYLYKSERRPPREEGRRLGVTWTELVGAHVAGLGPHDDTAHPDR